MKKIITLCALLVFAAISFPADLKGAEDTAEFSDIGENMYIDWLVDNGVLNGYPDGTFRPYNDVNRAELLKILIEGKGISPNNNRYQNCFPDVGREWFAPYVCYAKEHVWVQGYEDGTFRPNQTVSTAEALKITLEVLNIKIQEAVEGEEWNIPYFLVADEENIFKEGLSNAHKSMKRIDIAEIAAKANFVTYQKKKAKSIPEIHTAFDEDTFSDFIDHNFTVDIVHSTISDELRDQCQKDSSRNECEPVAFDNWVTNNVHLPRIEIGPLAPICIGDKSDLPPEEWGWYQEGKLIKKNASCEDGIEAVCEAIGTRSEGWYNNEDDMMLIKYEFCGNMDEDDPEEKIDIYAGDSKFVSRGELAKILIFKTGLEINTKGGAHYSDVKKDHEYYDYIETLYNSGHISDTVYDSWYPDQNITYSEASILIVSIFDIGVGETDITPWDNAKKEDWYDAVRNLYYYVTPEIYGDIGPTYDASRDWIKKVIETVVEKTK